MLQGNLYSVPVVGRLEITTAVAGGAHPAPSQLRLAQTPRSRLISLIWISAALGEGFRGFNTEDTEGHGVNR